MGKAIYDWNLLDPLLIELYSNDGGPEDGSVTLLARKLGINESTLRGRAVRLRASGVIEGYVQGHRRWTDEESKVLLKKLPKSKRNIEGRSYNAQQSRLYRQGIVNRESGYSLVDLAIALGCSTTTAYDLTQRKVNGNNVLKGTTNGRKGKSKRWYIKDEQMHAFVCTYKEIVDSYPCPGRLWLDGLLNDPILCREHGHNPPTNYRKTTVHIIDPEVVEYSGPICRRIRR